MKFTALTLTLIAVTGMAIANDNNRQPDLIVFEADKPMVASNLRVPNADAYEAPDPCELAVVECEDEHTYESASWTGLATWYGTGEGECVGCSENVVMANGQPLDDTAFTCAFNYAPLGTRLRVTNLSNRLSTECLVTDTGGFTAAKYARNGQTRIVDLTKAVRDSLAAGGTTEVIVEIIK